MTITVPATLLNVSGQGSAGGGGWTGLAGGLGACSLDFGMAANLKAFAFKSASLTR